MKKKKDVHAHNMLTTSAEMSGSRELDDQPAFLNWRKWTASGPLRDSESGEQDKEH